MTFTNKLFRSINTKTLVNIASLDIAPKTLNSRSTPCPGKKVPLIFCCNFYKY